ncbi:hypothetical protein [Clostridium sp. J1101437_171009_A5]|uniref:hypothetical protein n=1 Tax=Clostridium sp. J1101437_171009_A5 TaxID=2787098 RepID=UPI0018974C76|nr:hypothetical protein [Clostridium sp. J1101437_171009_A5]
MTEKEAKAFRSLVVQGATSLDDKTLSTAPDVLQRMQYDGSLIKNGTRINWGGTIKRAASDLWDREDQNPDNAPTLWEDVLYRDGIRIIPNQITVGLAFSENELGWWGDTLYRSLHDNNVYTPSEYPDWWEAVSV